MDSEYILVTAAPLAPSLVAINGYILPKDSIKSKDFKPPVSIF
jgi:hypothetical protein